MDELPPEVRQVYGVSKRQEQRRQPKDELSSFTKVMHPKKLSQYQRLRRFLFRFLITYTDTDPFFEQIVLQIAPFLDKEDQQWLEELIAQGQETIAEALTVVQKILHGQETLPLIDTYQLDYYGTIVETGTLPLLPIISSEDSANLSEYLVLLKEWHQDLVTFLKGRRLTQK